MSSQVLQGLVVVFPQQMSQIDDLMHGLANGSKLLKTRKYSQLPSCRFFQAPWKWSLAFPPACSRFVADGTERGWEFQATSSLLLSTERLEPLRRRRFETLDEWRKPRSRWAVLWIIPAFPQGICIDGKQADVFRRTVAGLYHAPIWKNLASWKW